ncbi:hypothetical protein [Mycobacterium sp. PSTR-4-N]|uniref:hypothetical protein n=1 Tax=Mycobacterium sp. PSTR-4-N TaxID=2917745 RepID=UPI001F1522C8|nr:hypothetical protein [Mycobacterium sp. PSTR-4-N]MCG7596346.1 hypothetical protein [Mycobacterium sp. PSTR-4-N]
MAATAARRKTTTEKGLGQRHQQQAAALKRKHQDGSPCDWCGKPMYLDRTKNPDYDPDQPRSGVLEADHGAMTRAEAVRRGLPIPLPDRLLHRRCNQQRGDGVNDHLAMAGRGTGMGAGDTEALAMAWPW